MSNGTGASGYGITIFKPGTPPGVKTRGIIFFIILCILIFLEAFYWLFANSAKPFVLGMPFSMFFIVLVIAIEFVVLLVLYFLEVKDIKEEGGV
jgi:phosphoglycerol transferase MdoB-like AlkP superfamily enzyme